jgi:uncharacterized protein (DUF362 family)
MSKKMNRRVFLKKSMAVGAASITGTQFFPELFGENAGLALGMEDNEISCITGANYFNNAVKAVEVLGGMKKYVSKGSKVGLLVNSAFNNPGTIVNPEVALAVIKMCYDAGAKEIWSLDNASLNYWQKSGKAKDFSGEIKSLKSAGKNYVKVELPKAITMKDAEVEKKLLECDILIDIPVVKDHTGTKFSCTLKNYMGMTSRKTNGYIHLGSGGNDYYGNIPHLSQCIADLNLVRKPDLCIVDATEFVTTNGPFGPGVLKKLNKVVAGVNRVAVDSYCSSFLGFKGNDVIMINKAYELGLREIDVKKLNIKEAGA